MTDDAPRELPLTEDDRIRLVEILLRVDQFTLALGRADFEVARVEGVRGLARAALSHEAAHVQQWIAETAAAMGLPDGWRFDAVRRVFLLPPV